MIARRWLQVCRAQQNNCSNDVLHHTTAELRTRLIDLHDADSAYLVPGRDVPPNIEYATLSHRWGQQISLQLERSSIGSFQKDGIPIHKLPKVFKQAMTATRNLGVRCFWIDRLCIVQDCDRDWQAESSEMDKVYETSTINIAAAGSQDSFGSLFAENAPHIKSYLRKVRVRIGSEERDYFAFDKLPWLRDVRESILTFRA